MTHNTTRNPVEAARLYAEQLEKDGKSYTVTVWDVSGNMIVNSERAFDWFASGFSVHKGDSRKFVNLHNALAVEVEPED